MKKNHLGKLVSVVMFTLIFHGFSLPSYALVSESAAGKKVIVSFLVNFAKFVEWPASAFETPESSIKVCVIGTDPFGDFLDKRIAKKKVKKRNFVVVRMTSDAIDGVKQCHIGFIGVSESERITDIADALIGVPVLTVSDVEGFAKAGGMIGLVGVGRKVRMQINKKRITNAGLKASEKLLRIGS